MRKRFRFIFLVSVMFLIVSIGYGISIPRKPRGRSYFVSYINYGGLDEWIEASKIVCRVRIMSVNTTGDIHSGVTSFNAKIIKSYKDNSLKGSTIVIGTRGIETDTEIREESMNPYLRIGAEEIFFLTYQDADGTYWYPGGFARYMVKPGRVYPLWGIQVRDEAGIRVVIKDGFSIDRFERIIRYYVDI